MAKHTIASLALGKLEYGTGAPSCTYDGVTRYIRITDIDNNGCLGNDFVSPEYYEDKHLLKDGDILFARTGATVGKTYIYHKEDGRCVYAGFLIRVIPNQKIVLPSYLYYFTKSKQYLDFVANNMKVVAQPNINAKQYGAIELSVPNIDAQKEVVSNLDKLSQLISLRKKQLQKLDDLVKSRFVEMFGDYDLSLQKTGWYKVSQIGTVVGGSTPKTNIPEYWNGEYRWISPAELKMDSGVIFDSEKKITKAGIESCSLQELPIGTVILSSRAPIGKVAIAGNTFYCNQGFKNIICSTKVKPRFLYTLLLYNTEYLNSLGRGATFKEISKSIVEEIRIPVPPLKDQERFVQYNDKIDGVRRCLKQGHDKLEQMKQALMQKYFG